MKWGGDHRQAADFALQAARGAAQGSLFRAASPDWPGAPEARNHAAMWLFLCGQKDLLRQELKALGPRLRESPWDYLGQPAEVFARARKYAGA